MPDAQQRSRIPLELVVFVVGAASLGAEIAAARMLAPFFGASTVVWANTIATVLLALAAGYWIGGRVADKRPEPSGLAIIVLVASVLFALLPFVADPVLRVAISALDSLSAGAFLGSLIGVMVLVAIPIALLGAAAPYALRLRIGRVEDSGKISGRLYGVSTAGSLAGVFLAALVLVPLVGTRRTFLCFALALALVAVPNLKRWFLAVPVVIVLLLFIPVGTVKGIEGSGARVIYEADTQYQYARVIEATDGTRTLELNEGQAVHSIKRPGSYLTNNYWDEMLVASYTGRHEPPRSVAVLGNAAGTVARALGKFTPKTEIVGVEIDGELSEIGRRYFDMHAPRLEIRTEDARPYLDKNKRKFDAIVLDAYHQPYIPFYLATEEFFKLVKQRLNPGGVLVINVGHVEGSDDLERVIQATVGASFPTVLASQTEPTNTTLIAGGRELSVESVIDSSERAPKVLQPAFTELIDTLQPADTTGDVYTDDRAPVELLIDRSIVEFAAR